MKLVYLGIIMASLLIAMSHIKPVNADSTDPVQILDVQVESSTLKVNDTFLISATILNSSPYPIYLTSGSCTPAFSVSFDIHVKQVHPDIACTLVAIQQKVDPQGEITISNYNKPGTTYQAVLAGTANANITIPYSAKNQTATDYSNIDYSISKSFQFVIHGSNETSQNIPAYVLPPLQQIRAGTLIQNVKCSANFNLIIKSEDRIPTCVKPDTVNILVERGWADKPHSLQELLALSNVCMGPNVACNKDHDVNSMADLKNDFGIITLKNQTYYFETPNYSHDAYFNPPQISFHDVTFTLFPAGFRGGLPIPCNAQGTDQYYWADAKFSDNAHELLHIQAESPPCSTNPIPTMSSNHMNPQAGLAFYDGKMKLLVSTENQTSMNPNSKMTHMELKAYGFVCCGLDGDLLKGNLTSNNHPITNASVAISINGVQMGYAKTFPDGCFQFNQWNDSKLSEQTNEFLTNARNSGSYSPFKLAFSAIYAGDDNNHYSANANATLSTSLIALPLPPPPFETTTTPSQVNVTQGSSSNFQISVKPIIDQSSVLHMSLYLDGVPCGMNYQISQASDNNTSSTKYPAIFDVDLNTRTYSPEGMYLVHIMQNGTNPLADHEVGTVSLNILKIGQ